jgi:predicted cupin superfamily sugar epimerase/mannose-6-phosphate isomerase-like protein (cupin superfamily)
MQTVLVALALALALVATSATAAPTGVAAQLIAHLRMEKIPDEGAWFAATYRSADALPTSAIARYDGVPHVAGSGIYALVTREDFSAFHRLRTDETWHYYSGDPLDLVLLYPDGRGETIVLGPDVLKGQQPQFTVPRGVWQAARPTGTTDASYTLFGCTLAPGFEYGDFTIGYRDELQKTYPAFARVIGELTRAAQAMRPTMAAPGTAPTAVDSGVFAPTDVAKLEVARGIELRELIGRTSRAKSDTHSIALFTLAAGAAMPMSHNKTSAEVLLVTAGSGSVVLGRQTHAVKAGSIVTIAPQLSHSVSAARESSLTFYAVSSPAFSPDDHVLDDYGPGATR